MRRSSARSGRFTLLAVDAATAAAVGLGATLMDAFGPDHRTNGAFFWDVVLVLPLVVRRRAPAVAATALGALGLAQWVTGVPASGDFAVLLMLYSLGAWDTRRRLLIAAVIVAQVGVVMAVTRWAPPSHVLLTGLMATGTVTASWVLGVYVRMRRAYLTSVIERAETAERDRDNRARIAVAAERARMAREMHDIITHSMSVMITLNDAAAAVSTSEEVRNTVGQASEVGRQALQDMQRLLGVLRREEPAELSPQPGTAQLSDLVAIVRSAGLAVELAITGTMHGLPPTAELAVYRIVQESLTNVLKHAHNATRVYVGIVCSVGRVTIEVRNDGDRVSAIDPVPGHGMVGMRERAALFGGDVVAAPCREGGWRTAAHLDVAVPVVSR